MSKAAAEEIIKSMRVFSAELPGNAYFYTPLENVRTLLEHIDDQNSALHFASKMLEAINSEAAKLEKSLDEATAALDLASKMLSRLQTLEHIRVCTEALIEAKGSFETWAARDALRQALERA